MRKLGNIFATTVLSAFLPLCLGCRSSKPVLVSAQIPFSVYSQSEMAKTTRTGGSDGFSFPQLAVFDKNGHLIYSGDDSLANSQFLAEVSHGLAARKVIGTPYLLTEAVDEIPAFRVHRAILLHSHKVCVLSISYGGCDGCTLQDGAVQSTEQLLLKRDIDVLVLHVLQ